MAYANYFARVYKDKQPSPEYQDTYLTYNNKWLLHQDNLSYPLNAVTVSEKRSQTLGGHAVIPLDDQHAVEFYKSSIRISDGVTTEFIDNTDIEQIYNYKVTHFNYDNLIHLYTIHTNDHTYTVLVAQAIRDKYFKKILHYLSFDFPDGARIIDQYYHLSYEIVQYWYKRDDIAWNKYWLHRELRNTIHDIVTFHWYKDMFYELHRKYLEYKYSK